MTTAGPSYSGLYWCLWSFSSLVWVKYLLRASWVLASNLLVIPSHCLHMILFFPVRLWDQRLYWKIEETLFCWVTAFVSCWSYTAGYKVIESGDHLESVLDGCFVFMPNHQSTADVPLCMALFEAGKRNPGRVMWVMDKLFKWTNFGFVSWIHDDFFILAGKANRERSLVLLRDHLAKTFVPRERKCLVLFPEGGFLKNRKAISNTFAEKNGLPFLEHCTLPRTGALDVILDVLSSGSVDVSGNCSGTAGQIDAGLQLSNGRIRTNGNNGVSQGHRLQGYSGEITKVVDVTIAYPEGKPFGLLDIVTGLRPPSVTHVHYRVFDVNQVPRDSEKLKSWMYGLYVEKEKMLSEYYRTGRFPHDMFDPDASPPRPLSHHPIKYLFCHVFYFTSAYVSYVLGQHIYDWVGNSWA